jgi:hypothetical protein
MNIYLILAFNITLNGILLSIVGIATERLLVKYGLIRGSLIEIVFSCFFIGFIMQFVDSGRAYLPFWLAASILTPVSLNRGDFIASLTRGRWWWKTDNNQ